MNVCTRKLFKLSNTIPIGKLHENEEVKFIYRYESELYKYDQSLCTRRIIQNSTSKNERTIIHDDKSNNYKAGQYIYTLIDTWNKTKKQNRLAGNF